MTIQNRTIMELTVTEEQTMRSISTTSGPIAINAQNALDFFLAEVVERFAEPIIVVPNSNRFGNTETSNLKP